MLLGCIADDFTGASDIANTLAQGRMRTRLYVGIPPDGADDSATEAAVIALKSRSVAADVAVTDSLRALEWLRRRRCRQIVFKYCSTFDSTPAGNIGPVAEALAQALGTRAVPVCPAFPGAGRTIYQGHLFVRDRLLSESGMQNHPLTPMTDPDIRRWLQRQCRGAVGLLDHSIVRSGSALLRQKIADAAGRNVALLVIDALDDEDLLTIGAAVADLPLVTGGSGIALGLPENFRRQGLISDESAKFSPIKGPALVLSGSCSNATREQVQVYAAQHPSFAIDPVALADSANLLEKARQFMREHRTEAPLVYSSDEPRRVLSTQLHYGRDVIAAKIEDFFGVLARHALADGVHKIVVAGGETSGAVVKALSIESFELGPEIAPGVPALRSGLGPDSLAMALKSGNFGNAAFFADAVAALGDAQ